MADRFALNGRTYAVLARFTGERMVEEANAFCEANEGASVLAATDTEVVIADAADAGLPLGVEPVEPLPPGVDADWVSLEAAS